jgi:ABC-type branched-subunit amino acid transport system substrate-binding protein
MRADRLVAAALAALALATGGCAGDEEEPLRIGVMVDCLGVFRNLEDASLAGAQLPLLERGARPLGARPSDGISPARVGGRRVELVRGCTEGGEFTTIVEEARRLVELEEVDAVVGGTWPGDGVVIREVARRYPDVPFVAVLSGPREVTLKRPAENLYRVIPDMAQTVAGLADYAYAELGWRRAAVLTDDWEGGWASADAFAAGFCRLGGRVTARVTIDVESAGTAVPVPADVDGVAVLVSGLFGPFETVRRLAAGRDDPAREVVIGPYATADPQLRGALGSVLEGAVGTMLVPAPGNPGVDAYVSAFAKAYPGLPREAALSENASAFRDSVEALVRAFERAGGPDRLRTELAATRDGLLAGQVRLDDNRQAVAAGTLVRLRRDGSLRTVRRLEPVDQSLDGALAPSLEPHRSDATW